MNHRKEELREIILELYEQGIPMAAIGRHFMVVDANGGEPMVRQHVYYYLQDNLQN